MDTALVRPVANSFARALVAEPGATLDPNRARAQRWICASGEVTAGPAPKGLVWIDLSISPEGWLVADTLKEAAPEKVLTV